MKSKPNWLVQNCIRVGIQSRLRNRIIFHAAAAPEEKFDASLRLHFWPIPLYKVGQKIFPFI
jgi:hypothetical protein